MKKLLLLFLLPLALQGQVNLPGAPVVLSGSTSGGGGGGAPSGPAGGVLSGTYPNPGFASGPTFTGTVTSNGIIRSTNGSIIVSLLQDGSNAYIGTQTSHDLNIIRNGVQVATFDASGLNGAAIGQVFPQALTATTVIFTPTARSSGVAPYFRINQPADTGLTAATEANGFRSVSATRTWGGNGTIVLQRENLWEGPTYDVPNPFSALISDVFTGCFTAPIVGPTGNLSFSRPHTLGVLDSTSASNSFTGGFVVSAAFGAGSPATSVGIGGGNVNAGGTITAGTGLTVTTGAANLKQTVIAGAAATTALTLTQTARTSGVLPYIKWTIPTDTGQTSATESPGVQSVSGTRTWAAGTVALQRENLFAAPTYAQASAGTFTEVATLAISGAPISGTNSSMGTTDAVLIQATTTTDGAGNAPTTTNSLKILNQTGGSSNNFAIQVGTSGTGITNIRHGITGALSGGTLVVTDTGSTANTRYFFTTHTLGTIAIPASYYVSARSAGASFTITSSAPTDTSTVDWMAIEP